MVQKLPQCGMAASATCDMEGKAMESNAVETITAEQAAEEAKGLTFEIVWTALMETRILMQESQRESQKRMDESQKRMDEAYAKTQLQFEKTQRTIDELSKNIGGLNNSLGRFSESLFSVGLDKLFTDLGYTFTKQGPNVKFKEKGTRRVLAEVDYFLEDGEYAMAVEVKTEPEVEDIKEHLERIAVIREYFDARNDKRILVGAVAGNFVRSDVQKYAHKKGLYVITQSDDSAMIADPPKGFKAREW